MRLRLVSRRLCRLYVLLAVLLLTINRLQGSSVDEVATTEHDEASSYLHPSDRRRRERLILQRVMDHFDIPSLKSKGKWGDADTDHCDWEGVTCGGLRPDDDMPDDSVGAIRLREYNLEGTIPTEIGILEYLQVLDLSSNKLTGTLPDTITTPSLLLLNLRHNMLTGTIPTLPPRMEVLYLSGNQFTGPFPGPPTESLWILDVSQNELTGTIPDELVECSKMKILLIGDNLLEGTLPHDLCQLSLLNLLDVGSNALTGPLPPNMRQWNKLLDLNLADNLLSGTIPSDLLQLERLQVALLSQNQWTGTLPTEGSWSTLSYLATLAVDDNRLHGTISLELFEGLAGRLNLLDLSRNQFTGSIATQIGLMKSLHTINAHGNALTGVLPNEMLQMNMNLRLNFTDNRLTGTIPGMFCGVGAPSLSMLYREFGCDAVLCRPGTFNIHGHATLHSACRPCPKTEEGERLNPKESTILGRVSCPGTVFVHGDLDGDGKLTAREILRMIYVDNIGKFWGHKFQTWADMSVGECSLYGVECHMGKVTKIDLSEAALCSNAERRAGPLQFCDGLPAEIGQLSHLEVLKIVGNAYLRGSIPSELGNLSNLYHLEISRTTVGGTLPSELGNLAKLRQLTITVSHLEGTLPEEIFHLPELAKLQLTKNDLTGPLPNNMTLPKAKEILLARNKMSGSIPSSIGGLTLLENLEGYSNSFSGKLPLELSHCQALKRIDIYDNKLTGTLPDAISDMANMQIFHGKKNKFTGTIPESYGRIPMLFWIDLSENQLHGTIPASFAASKAIKDVRVAGNMIHDPIPLGLCKNSILANGATAIYGCDAVLCPMGTFSSTGYASDKNGGCTPCPEGQSTLYLGSLSCQRFTETEVLSMFFHVMQGESWASIHRRHWLDPDKSVCEWSGIRCSDDGEIMSIRFPVVGAHELY